MKPSHCDDHQHHECPCAARSEEACENQQRLSSIDLFSSSSLIVQGRLDHVRLPFAYKLHILLCDMEINGSEDIISWVEDGNAFKIHDRQRFEEVIQPRYFRQSKITSFIRQVSSPYNRKRISFHSQCRASHLGHISAAFFSFLRPKCYAYGFSKIEFGPGQGSYVHPNFQKSNQAKSLTIQRHHQNPTNRVQRHHQRAVSPTSKESSPKTRKITTDIAKPAIRSTRNYISPYPVPFSNPNPYILDSMSSRSRTSELSDHSNDHRVKGGCDDCLQQEHSCPQSWSVLVDDSFIDSFAMLEEENDPFVLEPRPIEIMLLQSCHGELSLSHFFPATTNHQGVLPFLRHSEIY